MILSPDTASPDLVAATQRVRAFLAAWAVVDDRDEIHGVFDGRRMITVTAQDLRLLVDFIAPTETRHGD